MIRIGLIYILYIDIISSIKIFSYNLQYEKKNFSCEILAILKKMTEKIDKMWKFRGAWQMQVVKLSLAVI